MSVRLPESCAAVIMELNTRIAELCDASVSGCSVRREVINIERWMRERYECDHYAPIRDVIEPFRFRTAVRASVSFQHNWRNYNGWTDQTSVDLWPYAEIKGSFDPWRTDVILARWRHAGGIVVGRDRRMIAAKNCGVWAGFSIFGLPYPPFDAYLDMAVIDIDRDESCMLGIMQPNDELSPPPTEPKPAHLTIDSEVVTLIADANRLTPGRVSPT